MGSTKTYQGHFASLAVIVGSSKGLKALHWSEVPLATSMMMTMMIMMTKKAMMTMMMGSSEGLKALEWSEPALVTSIHTSTSLPHLYIIIQSQQLYIVSTT